MNRKESVLRNLGPRLLALLLAVVANPLVRPLLAAQEPARRGGGEANLIIPDLSSVSFFGIPGHTLLMAGLVVCALGLLFGLVIYSRLKNMAVHSSMRAISELIYETCKTYLITQGKFIAILELFIAAIIVLYFGVLSHRIVSLPCRGSRIHLCL